MKEPLRISLLCLSLAFALHGLFCYGQDLPWLQFNTHKTPNMQDFRPQHTVIISSVRPTIKQLAENRWEISFSP
jgi:hypothetical protein